MKKIVIEDQGILDLLEAEGYEVNSRQSLLAYMAKNGVLPSETSFQDYHGEFQEHFVKYEAAKAQLERQYVQPLTGGKSAVWNLDFATHELTIQGID